MHSLPRVKQNFETDKPSMKGGQMVRPLLLPSPTTMWKWMLEEVQQECAKLSLTQQATP